MFEARANAEVMRVAIAAPARRLHVVILETKEWAQATFGDCELGDVRRTKRLVRLAEQVAARPDGSTPDQTESFGDCKAAYRLFDQDDVTFDEITRPHCQQTRASCRPGDVKLIINDTTEIDFGHRRRATGLGPTGNGSGRGFFLHSALMVDATTGAVAGLAGQILFHRQPKSKRRVAKNTRRRSSHRESVVWGDLVDRVGSAPGGVKYVHVDDRGADDFEVFCRIQARGASCVIRAARLNRWIETSDDRRVRLGDLLKALTSQGTRTLEIAAKDDQPARTATLELRFASLRMPVPQQALTPWLRDHRPLAPLPMGVVELREVNAPADVTPLRWVLYTFEPVTTAEQADVVIRWYKNRPTIEDYHKALKTGCHVQKRYYETSDRWERVTGLLSVVAVRLLQLKTAARETPDRPAIEVAPAAWVELVQIVRKKPVNPAMTIREFLRAVAGLGGHLGRKSDGDPGWITTWRGFEKLMILARGATLRR
jgi:Transposase DNA-binding/Transposase Tn5 dimerisation domain